MVSHERFLGALTLRLVHPTAPVLLTKIGPLGTVIRSPASSFEYAGVLTHLKFENSYPEGNFGRNQLLDGSISLSPLYPVPTIDLHVRIATVLHQGFP
ncbi:unnamed protein product [Parnassius mnemosyne]|uniref:Uncharacterized protein n=1 Tax=Parnassius mnemosyne TaxID=213953 RepID=A0AAV1M1J1_9NEOP